MSAIAAQFTPVVPFDDDSRLDGLVEGAELSRNSCTPPHSWEADADNDRTCRRAMVEAMTGCEQLYTDDETRALGEGMSLFAAVRSGEGKARALKHRSTIDFARTRQDKLSGLLIGEAQALVRGAAPEDIVAFLMHFDSRHFTNAKPVNGLIATTTALLEKRNLHHIVTLAEYRRPPFKARVFVNSVIWQKISDSPRPLAYIVIGVPSDHHLAPTQEPRSLRAEGRRAFKLTQVGERVTQVEYACSVDLKGIVPHWATEQFVIPALMGLVYDVQSYFQQMRPLDECVAEDGIAIGMMLVDTADCAAGTESTRVGILRDFMMHTVMLKDCDFRLLDAMLVAVIISNAGSTQQGMHAVLRLDPTTLTEKDATVIGESLRRIVYGQASLKPAAAVGELLHRCAATAGGSVPYAVCSRLPTHACASGMR